MRYPVLVSIMSVVGLWGLVVAGSEPCDWRDKPMNQSVESRVIEKFRENVARGDLDGVHIVNRIAGGMPGEGRIDEEFYISGRNQARFRARTTGAPAEDTTSELSDAEVQRLFQQISTGVSGLVPRSQAQFVPDSVVGSITIEVDGEQATFFYLVEEEEREAQGQPMAPEMSEALDNLSTLSKALREKKEE